jgi:serine protease
VAALVLAINPTLPTAALRDVVLNSGDPVASLQGITVTGRRLNAASALAAGAPAPPP